MSAKRSFGIRGRMFLAFGMIAAVTVVTSVVAWFAYGRLGDNVQRIVHKDISAVSLAGELVALGGVITATAPSLVSATEDAQREQSRSTLIGTLHDMQALVASIYPGETERGERESREKLIDVLAANLRDLDGVVRQRLRFAEQSQDLSEKLRWAHADFLDEVEPMIDDARFLIGLGLEQPRQAHSSGSDEREKTLQDRIAQQETLLHIKAAGNLLVVLISRAATLTQQQAVRDTLQFALEVAEPVKGEFETLVRTTATLSLQQSFDAILTYVDGDKSLFQLRSDTLDLEARSGELLDTNRKLVTELQEEIARHAHTVNEQAQAAAAGSNDLVSRTKTLFVFAALGSIVITILSVWLYVGRHLVGRITALDTSMRRIARGDLKADVPTGGDDEIADMAQALRTFRDTLTETQAELVQAAKLAALGQLSAGIAHELNQPLAAIGSRAHNARVLLDRNDPGEARSALMTISKLSKRMAKKINNLKTLARKPSSGVRNIDLKTVVDDTLDILQDRLRKDAVSVVNRLPDSKIPVMGGAIRLEQVLLNVIGNALDSMAGAKNRRLTLETEFSEEMVSLLVSDTGHGIPEGVADKMFDPFFTTKDVDEGLGLGLTISYNIVKDLGGAIRARRNADGGATFVISLERSRELVPA